jgi:nucleotide-binding universal stress UspA family protein
MFKHILIPTDGSATAAKAVERGVELAKQLGARVTGYHACEPARSRVYGEGYIIGPRDTAQQSNGHAREAGEKFVAQIADAARAAGVPFDPLVVEAEAAYRGIIDAATRQNCDAIFMASHGRSSIAELVLGSVTHQVLAHSKIPVLVYR